MNQKIFLWLGIILLVTGALAAQTPQKPENFKYMADFKGAIEKKEVYRFPLAIDILRKCLRPASEMRVFDGQGLEIPFVIIDNLIEPGFSEHFDLIITGYDDLAGYSLLTLKSPRTHTPIVQLSLSVPQRDFRKSVELSGSTDQKTWTVLAEDSIYDFSSQVDLRKTEISFTKSDYPFLRLKISDHLEKGQLPDSIQLKYENMEFRVDQAKTPKLRFDRITAKTAEKFEKKMVFDSIAFQSFPLGTGMNQNSEISLEAGLPFHSIEFAVSNDFFFRRVSIYGSDSNEKDSFRFLTTGTIYKFPLLGREESNNHIAYGLPHDPQFRFYKIVIENKNNPPLVIGKITLSWIQKNLFFIGLNNSAPYRLFFGNPSATRPDYDISRFIRSDNWQQLDAQIIAAGPVTANAGFKPKISGEQKSKREKIILMAVVIGLVLLIGFYIFK